MTAEYLVSSGAPAQLTPGAYEARLIENSDPSLPREKTSMAESHREQHCSRPTPKANRTATSPAGLISQQYLADLWLWFTLRREKPTPETGPVCLEHVVDSSPTGEYSRAFFRRTDSS